MSTKLDVVDGICYLMYINDILDISNDFTPYYADYVKYKMIKLKYDSVGDYIADVYNVVYIKETNVIDLQGQSINFCMDILNEHGTFDFKFINWPDDCSNMFKLCANRLVKLPNHFTIPNNVINCESMFAGTSLEYLPENFQLSNKIKNCVDMFRSCVKLKEIPTNFRLPEGVIECTSMFRYTSIQQIPEGFTIPKSVEDCTSMFRSCQHLTKIPKSFKVTNKNNICTSMFENCAKLSELPDIFSIPRDGMMNNQVDSVFAGSPIYNKITEYDIFK